MSSSRVSREALGRPWRIGLAAVAAVAVVGAPRAKPLAKEAIKTYFALAAGAQHWAAETVEQIEDLYAEAKYEHRAERAGAAELTGAVTAAAPAPPTAHAEAATALAATDPTVRGTER